MALDEMTGSVEGVLATMVSSREGDEDWVTSPSGQRGALDSEEVLDSQPAARPV